MFARINFESLFGESSSAYALLARDLTLAAANEAYLQAVEWRGDNIAGNSIFTVFPPGPNSSDADRVQRLCDSCDYVLAERKPQTIVLMQCPGGGPDSSDVCWNATHTPIFDEHGKVVYILQRISIATELQLLRQALRKEHAVSLSQERMEAEVARHEPALPDIAPELSARQDHMLRLFKQAPGFICFLRGERHVFELANDAYYQLVGRRELIGKTVAESLPELVGQGYTHLLDQVYRSGKPYVAHGARILLQRREFGSTEEMFVDFVYQPITTPDGTVSGVFIQGNDVTERYRIQEELDRYRTELEDLVLERTRELEESEAALRHAQKMEAVGRLTGGVAHDFNNLLQVIGGNLQLIQRDAHDPTTMQRRLAAAQASVERGARLASQLLAFARRQPLEPVVIKLDALLQDMEELLRRVLGETVELVTRISPVLWNTFADPGQVENVILNLAINARDAMGGSGRLTIEAANARLPEDEAGLDQDAKAGEYVMLMVSDTGIGMASEVREQAFEPFFTTKPEGQGTGLGLSMVYGFVKQSGGQIILSSESGQGTAIRIYLPRALEAEVADSQRLSGPVEGGNETILVVEDDPDVRCTTIDMLTGLGYRVLEASDASGALALIQEGHAVDLLFTDVIMPGPLSSIELARRAKLILPDLIVLFTSGYTDDALVRGGRLDQGVSLLSKPFHHDDLARKIRHLFRNRQQAAAIREAVPTAKPAPPKPPAAPSLRILIVEDEEFIREALQELLADTGHEIAVAGTAEEAQELLTQRRFDVLFTDVSLPGKSGIELATAAVEQWPDLKVIIASGYGKELPTPLGEALADSIFLPKPYDIGEIEQAIAQIAYPDRMAVQ